MNTQELVVYEAYLQEMCEKIFHGASKAEGSRAACIAVLKKSGARVWVLMARIPKAVVKALDVTLSPSETVSF